MPGAPFQLRTVQAMRAPLAGLLAWVLGFTLLFFSQGTAFERQLADGSSPTIWTMAHLREALGAEVIRRNGAGPRADSIPRRGLLLNRPKSDDEAKTASEPAPPTDHVGTLPPRRPGFLLARAVHGALGLSPSHGCPALRHRRARAPPDAA